MSTFRYIALSVANVHDGDTATLNLATAPVVVDLGFGLAVTVQGVTVGASLHCRLAGIAAAELATPGGPAARDYLTGLLGPGVGCTVISLGWDKYAGRYDGLIYLPDGRCVNDLMVAGGMAAPWDGVGKQPVPAWPAVPQPDYPIRTLT